MNPEAAFYNLIFDILSLRINMYIGLYSRHHKGTAFRCFSHVNFFIKTRLFSFTVQ